MTNVILVPSVSGPDVELTCACGDYIEEVLVARSMSGNQYSEVIGCSLVSKRQWAGLELKSQINVVTYFILLFPGR